MSIIYRNNKIELIYIYPDDADITFEEIDKHSGFHNVSRIDMVIADTAITQKFCDDIEYVLKKVSKIDRIIFSFNNNMYPDTHDTVTRLLHIFDGIDMIYLNTSSTYRITSSNYNIIKTFLAQVSTKKLLLDRYFDFTNEFVNVINSNDAIKSVKLTFSLQNISFLDADPVLKIDAMNIIDSFVIVTDHHLEKIFRFAPNLKKICFKGKDTCIFTSMFDVYAFEKIINFVLSKQQFDELHFQYCNLNDNDISYACDKLLEYNISSIMFVDYNYYKNKTMCSITNLIKNNTYLKAVSISNIKSTDALLHIVESLANTNITKFIATSGCLSFDYAGNETYFKNKIIDILSENYVLTHICIKYKVFIELIVDTSSIVNRNIELAQKRRFMKTKAVVSID